MNILPNKPPRIYLCVELLTLLRKCEHFLTVNSFSTLTLRFSYCWGWGLFGEVRSGLWMEAHNNKGSQEAAGKRKHWGVQWIRFLRLL